MDIVEEVIKIWSCIAILVNNIKIHTIDQELQGIHSYTLEDLHPLREVRMG